MSIERPYLVYRSAPNGEMALLERLPTEAEAAARMAFHATAEMTERFHRAGVDPLSLLPDEREQVVQQHAINGHSIAIWAPHGNVRAHGTVHSIADVADADELAVYHYEPAST